MITVMCKTKHPKSNDWRRQGQESYLKDVTLTKKEYKPYRQGWEHDHCEFCGVKFSLCKDDLTEGYSTPNYYHWVCEECYEDFKFEFGWEKSNMTL